jgi:SAM-dependent methyltransferase
MLHEYTAMAGFHDHLFRCLPPLAPGPLLDVGCGSGAWLSRFPDRDRFGIDGDPGKLGASDITFIRADLDNDPIDLGPRRFALITAIEVLEHLDSPGRVVALAGRYLADDGWLLLSTPNLHSAVARLRWLVKGTPRFFPEPGEPGEPEHVSGILLPWVRKVLPKYGLQPEKVWGFPERGTVTARRLTSLVAVALERVVPRGISGDTLCVLARRTSAGSP